MSNVIHGRDVNVLIDISGVLTYIGCASGCVWTFENEIIAKTDVNAGLFRKKRVRISDSRGSITGVMTTSGGAKASVFYFLQEAVRRQELDFTFLYVDENGGDVAIEMTAIINTCTLTADVSNFAEFDLEIEGTGNISIGTIVPPVPVVCDDLKSDYWTTTPGATSITGVSANGVATTLAGKTVIAVDREGLGQDSTNGTPGNRQYRYTGINLLETDALNPYNPGETINVIWLEP